MYRMEIEMVKKKNLQQLLIRYWIGLFVVFFLIYLIAQFFFLKNLTIKAEENIGSKVYVSSSNVEKMLDFADSYIYEAMYNGSTQSPSKLYSSLQSEEDPVKLLETKSAISASINSIVNWSDAIDYIFFYTQSDNEPIWIESANGRHYNDKKEVKTLIKDQIEQNDDSTLRRYMVVKGTRQNYMVRIIKFEQSYFVVGVSTQEILNGLSEAATSDDSIVFAADENGDIIVSSADISGSINVLNEGQYVEIGEKSYLQTGYVSDRTGYYFGILTSKDSIISDLWVFRIIFACIAIALLIMAPVSCLIVSRKLITPINLFAGNMNRFSEGNLDITMEDDSNISELSYLVKTFNNMAARIKKLKIEKYEAELESQKATMQYLQQQIKPHFFANTLNIIYSLAQRRDFETIQRLSKAIVNYSRYMFYDTRELVELSKELDYLDCYMEIQEIRYVKQIKVDLNIEDGLRSALVPPFLILTFVENSVKYAFSTQKNCLIEISAHADEKKEYITMIIKDNGGGYPERIIKAYDGKINVEGHVGLNNIRQRLKLIFDDKASIELKNEEGAVTIIKIPCITINDSDFEDDF